MSSLGTAAPPFRKKSEKGGEGADVHRLDFERLMLTESGVEFLQSWGVILTKFSDK